MNHLDDQRFTFGCTPVVNRRQDRCHLAIDIVQKSALESTASVFVCSLLAITTVERLSASKDENTTEHWRVNRDWRMKCQCATWTRSSLGGARVLVENFQAELSDCAQHSPSQWAAAESETRFNAMRDCWELSQIPWISLNHFVYCDPSPLCYPLSNTGSRATKSKCDIVQLKSLHFAHILTYVACKGAIYIEHCCTRLSVEMLRLGKGWWPTISITFKAA